MKTSLRVVASAAVLVAGASAVSAQEIFTGDTRLACEAILCLSAGPRPGECAPSLARYFGISKKGLSDTVNARLNFLSLCPVANQTPQMQSLVSAISRGADRCDAASLNNSLLVWQGSVEGGTRFISNQIPDYCAAYTDHEYTDLKTSGILPRYVGIPERGGYWVEARDYDQALTAHNGRIKAEDDARPHATMGSQ